MDKLKETLIRLGAAKLVGLIGKEDVALIKLLEMEYDCASMADLLIESIGATGLLTDNKIRPQIIRALREPDVNLLAKSLGQAGIGYQVGDIKFRKGSENIKTLFDYFGVKEPLAENTNKLLPSKEIVPTHPLFPHQREAYLKVLHALNSAGRVLLHMPTGSGKTRTAMNVVAHYLREIAAPDDVVIWLAYSEELCNQAADEFEKAWGEFGQRPVTIYRHYGDARVSSLSDVKNGFFVSSLPLLYKHSLDHQSDFLKLSKRTVFVVFDEAHQLPAPTYQHLVNLLQISRTPSILGLSATPGRAVSQKDSDTLRDFFHGNRVTLEVDGYSNPVEYLQKEGYLSSPIFEDLNIPWGAKLLLTQEELSALQTGFDLPDSVLLKLGASDYRNLAIIKRIETELSQLQMAKKTMKMILFACSVKQSKTLANILKKRGIKAYSVTGDTDSTQRTKALSEFKDSKDPMVITNYGVLTTGFDAPKTNVAFIARPTSSVGLYSQMVGRALRGHKVGGNDVSKIVSVQDNIPGFKSIGDLFNHWNNIWKEN